MRQAYCKPSCPRKIDDFGSWLRGCFPAALATSLLLFGCQSRTDTGAPSGGAASRAVLDSTDRDSLRQQSAQTLRKIDNREELSIEDIKRLTKAKLSDNAIIGQIKATNSAYVLSTADIIDLKNAGVSQKVIDSMIQSGH